MPYIVSGKQYSGSWTMQQHFQAVAAQTWTGMPALYTWGYAYYGNLGLNDTTNRSSLVQVGTLTTWSSASNAGYHSVAIKTDGTLWAWGNNLYGQLGQNNVVYRSSPVQVGLGTTWSKVSAGQWHATAIKTDGTLWSWGRNQRGQLGQNDATTNHRSSPTQVGALTNWLSVSAGYSFTAAIKTDGTLWTWGLNDYGQLGQNTGATVYRSSPVQVGLLTNWLSVSAGQMNHMAAIKTDGTLWTWGLNLYGQLGQNNVVYGSSPVQIGALTNWLSVSAGMYHTTAIKTNGTLWTWGNNTQGRLGQNDAISRSSPVQIGALTNWLSVSAGNNNTAAIKTDGTLWTWGYNGQGALGQNDTIDRSSPTQVGALTTWSSVSTSTSAGIAIGKTTT